MIISLTVQPSRRKRKAEASEVVVKSKISKSPEPVDLYVPSENWNFKIISWNVAGLRALIKKDGMEFLKKESPDIICLQVSKAFGLVSQVSKKSKKKNLRKLNAWKKRCLQMGI